MGLWVLFYPSSHIVTVCQLHHTDINCCLPTGLTVLWSPTTITDLNCCWFTGELHPQLEYLTTHSPRQQTSYACFFFQHREPADSKIICYLLFLPLLDIWEVYSHTYRILLHHQNSGRETILFFSLFLAPAYQFQILSATHFFGNLGDRLVFPHHLLTTPNTPLMGVWIFSLYFLEPIQSSIFFLRFE